MGADAESDTLREYRHLLRTASADWQETAHRHALTAMGPSERAAVLAEVRRLLLAGTRVGVDDVHAIARLLVLAERRRPRLLLDQMQPDLLGHLATRVVASPIGRMLRAGYDVWDGQEPPRPYEPPVTPDLHQNWHTQIPSLGTDLGATGYVLRPSRRR
ncbi:hypothetical protein [uncultured Phycicoccus sp.]|uniref:hypothetical protein n=1 Tax=uncultured Phycicoccus sp. TaxID=661422 RepID=UPI0026157189|nr:hypothetical protein [uncultured Phycicoccus sp.]